MQDGQQMADSRLHCEQRWLGDSIKQPVLASILLIVPCSAVQAVISWGSQQIAPAMIADLQLCPAMYAHLHVPAGICYLVLITPPPEAAPLFALHQAVAR